MRIGFDDVMDGLTISLFFISIALIICLLGMLLVFPHTFSPPEEVDEVSEERYTVDLLQVDEPSEDAIPIQEFSDEESSLIRSAIQSDDLSDSEIFEEENALSLEQTDYIVEVQGINFLMTVEIEQQPPPSETGVKIIAALSLIPLLVPMGLVMLFFLIIGFDTISFLRRKLLK